MSISTAIVYSIFYIAGNSAVAYVPPDAQQAVRYENAQQCKDALRDIRIDLATKINMLPDNGKGISPQDRTALDQASQKAQSMSCEEIEVELPPSTQAQKVTAVPAKATNMVFWKIGRIDQSNIFHGTQYNEYAYDDETSCNAAYTNTQTKVFDRAIADGGNNVQAAQVLSSFNDTYACNQVSLKAEEIVRQPAPKAVTVPQVSERPVVQAQVTAVPAPVQQQPVVQQPAPAQESALMPVLTQLAMQGQFLQQTQQMLSQQQLQQQQLTQQQISLLQSQQVQPVQQQPVTQQYQQYQPRQTGGYASSPYPNQGYPVRSVYIAETVRDNFGSSSQFLYPTPYGTVAECWNAVNMMFGVAATERRNAVQCVYAAR